MVTIFGDTPDVAGDAVHAEVAGEIADFEGAALASLAGRDESLARIADQMEPDE